MQFLRAGPILAETALSDSKVSLAECFLFLASKVKDKDEAFYPTKGREWHGKSKEYRFLIMPLLTV